MSDECWAACQTFSGKEHKIRSEIEGVNRGAFLPTFARLWSVGGLPSAREYPLIPGYVFFRTKRDEWGCVGTIEGVHRVLSNGQLASPVSTEEMTRMMLGHAAGDHNRIEFQPAPPRGKRRRKPRPGRRIRNATVTLSHE